MKAFRKNKNKITTNPQLNCKNKIKFGYSCFAPSTKLRKVTTGNVAPQYNVYGVEY